MAAYAEEEQHLRDKDDEPVDDQILKGKTIWSAKENALLGKLVEAHGTTSWTRIAESFLDRTGKQCRERWHNHLENGVVKGGWSHKEDKIILSMQTALGNQWALISKMLPGRTDNAVKNRFHAIQRAKNRGRLHEELVAIVPGTPLDADTIAIAKSINDPQLNHELNQRLPHIFKCMYVFEDSVASFVDTATKVAKQNASHPDGSSSYLSSRGAAQNNSSSGSGANRQATKSGKGKVISTANAQGNSRVDNTINKMSSLDILALVAQISDQSVQYQSSQTNANTPKKEAAAETGGEKCSKHSKSKSASTSSSYEYFQSLGQPRRQFKNGGGRSTKDNRSNDSGRTSGDNMSSSKSYTYFDLTSSSNGGDSSTTYNPSSGGTTSSNNTSEQSHSGTNSESSSTASGSGRENSCLPGPTEENSEGSENSEAENNSEGGNSEEDARSPHKLHKPKHAYKRVKRDKRHDKRRLVDDGTSEYGQNEEARA